ncbi:DUF4099 domain-containing protein [Mucilaginibacter lappiensis]|uniref:DUF4099 domain-containing protein n=1 Tax=Mucilaginibacter lappiensis TaxID=354630 RepID=A0A841JUJ7_9SPHI|nr:DUF4099 domain-containing protein [Mucilaginibacter lappiensis]MBB6131501.1 hypothetical protein [Mucilaginibacter lappiensis]
MNTHVYKASQLPIKELESLGLAKNGKILMDKSDVQSMLEGRRSDMIRLNNIVGPNVKIEKLDAKISLAPDNDGNLKLQFHPIYKDPQYPSFLNEAERTALETDSALNLEKTIVGKDGKPENVLVEYDKETREFIITDTDKVQVPDMVNSEKLTFEQREKYRRGKEVQLADGTRFKQDNTQKQGIISNKGKLVAAFLLGGPLAGLAYLAYSEIKDMKRKPQANQNVEQTEGYKKAYASMLEKNGNKGHNIVQATHIANEQVSKPRTLTEQEWTNRPDQDREQQVGFER